MDPLALIAIGGLIFAANKMKKSGYRTGQYQDMVGVDNGNSTQIMNMLNNTNQGPSYGGGIQNTSPENIQKGTGIPLIRKGPIYGPGFNIGKERYDGESTSSQIQHPAAPDVSNDVYKNPVHNLTDRSAQYMTNVQNNQAPFPIQHVGKGLGIGPNVPAAGGFHQDYRILTTNINEQNLIQLPGPGSDPSQMPGAPIVKMGSLAPSSYASIDGSSDMSQPGSTTRLPRANNQGGVLPTPGGGVMYAPPPDSLQNEKSTKRYQNMIPSNGGYATTMVPVARQPPMASSAYTSDQDSVKYTNRGQSVPNMMPGGQSLGSSTSGRLTTVIDDNNSIPQGNFNSSMYQQHGNLGQAQFNPYKGQSNPFQPNNTTAEMASNNPYVIPSFAPP